MIIAFGEGVTQAHTSHHCLINVFQYKKGRSTMISRVVYRCLIQYLLVVFGSLEQEISRGLIMVIENRLAAIPF